MLEKKSFATLLTARLSAYTIYYEQDKSGWDKRIRVSLKFLQKVSNQWRG